MLSFFLHSPLRRPMPSLSLRLRLIAKVDDRQDGNDVMWRRVFIQALLSSVSRLASTLNDLLGLVPHWPLCSLTLMSFRLGTQQIPWPDRGQQGTRPDRAPSGVLTFSRLIPHPSPPITAGRGNQF